MPAAVVLCGLTTVGRRLRSSGISKFDRYSYPGSMSDIASRIKASQGAYPERVFPREGWLDRAGGRFVGPLLRWNHVRRARSGRFVQEVGGFGKWVANLN